MNQVDLIDFLVWFLELSILKTLAFYQINVFSGMVTDKIWNIIRSMFLFYHKYHNKGDEKTLLSYEANPGTAHLNKNPYSINSLR